MKITVGLLTAALFTVSFLATGCDQGVAGKVGNTIDAGKKPSFAIYLADKKYVNDAFPDDKYAKNGSVIESKDWDLEKVELNPEPLLTDIDIKEYDWKNQRIKLNDVFLAKRGFTESDQAMLEFIDFAYRDGGSKLLGTTQDDVGVVTLNGRRIYAVGFTLALTSSRSKPPIMIGDAARDTLGIDNYRKTDDLRQDKRIYQFFKQEGKLKN
jgi:hypothetical protein